ncbi:hypothetical protein BH11PLA2_BH11PLA2_12620 [soil metagenome]
MLAQGTPAPTTWQPYQAPQTKSAPVAPPVEVPNQTLNPAPVPPPKMVTFQKPVNETQPMVAPLPVPQLAPLPPLSPRMELPPLPELPSAPAPQPKMTRVPAQPIPVQQQPVLVRPVARQVPPTPPVEQPKPLPAPMATPMPAPPKSTTPQLLGPDGKPLTAADVIPGLAGTLGGLPNQQDLFRLQSDADLDARILKEIREKPTENKNMKPGDDKFPVLKPMVPAGVAYAPRAYPPSQIRLEPAYVIHRRLFFEEMNSERAGWDAGVAQSVFSSAYFFRDVLLWPSRVTSHMKECYDASSGKCRPGDPTPYYYYPHGVTWFGALVGGTLYTGIGFIVF